MGVACKEDGCGQGKTPGRDALLCALRQSSESEKYRFLSMVNKPGRIFKESRRKGLREEAEPSKSFSELNKLLI